MFAQLWVHLSLNRANIEGEGHRLLPCFFCCEDALQEIVYNYMIIPDVQSDDVGCWCEQSKCYDVRFHAVPFVVHICTHVVYLATCALFTLHNNANSNPTVVCDVCMLPTRAHQNQVMFKGCDCYSYLFMVILQYLHPK